MKNVDIYVLNKGSVKIVISDAGTGEFKTLSGEKALEYFKNFFYAEIIYVY